MDNIRNIEWICPHCHNILDEILFCNNCHYKGIIKDNLFHLYKNGDSWKECIKEKAGWISIHKEQNIYINNEDHFFLPDGRPHLAEFYKEAKRAVEKFLEIENINDKTLLDIGAGIGWVDCYILQKIPSAKIIAFDCNDDEWVGLGRANILKSYHKVDFISLVGDMHNIPIAENSIDIVLMVDALHHFLDMEKVFEEAYRVLKPRGHFYAINEPYRPDNIFDEKQFLREVCPTEVKHGINERRPKRTDYLTAGKSLRLKIINEEIGFLAPGLILYGEK